VIRLLAILDRKLVRDLWHIRGQVLAIALVIAAGVATMVMATGTHRSLEETRAAYYDGYRFADIFAYANRAPEAMVGHLAEIPGVARVESRIVDTVLLDMPGIVEPVRGQVLSLPEDGIAALNAIVLRRGRLPSASHPDEVVVSEAFAEAHDLLPGDAIQANLNGRRRDLIVVGVALSPEFIYAIAPGDFVPDDRRFGIFWMGRDALEAAYDLDGAFNNVTLAITRTAVEEDVIRAVDDILRPYGGIGAFGRDDHPSHAFIDGELDELEALTTVVPPIFLIVAAFLLNLVTGRLIDTEREQIGLMKAFGFTSYGVGWHYVKLVLVIAFLGIAIGFAGGYYTGRGLTALYGGFFRFPFLYFSLDTATFAAAGLISMAAALAGALMAVRRAISLQPAVAMRPPPPASYKRTVVDRLYLTWAFGAEGRMVLRHMLRWPLRSSLTALGIALSTALLISTLFFLDAMDEMLELFFFDNQRQDVTVSFTLPTEDAVAADLLHMPGVHAVELFRSVPARLINGQLRERMGITGRDPGANLTLITDVDGFDVALPSDGIVLNDALAEDLDARVGDLLTVEILDGRQPTLTVPVSLVVREYVGRAAYMDRTALNRLVGDGQVASGAYLIVDSDQHDALFYDLTHSPAVEGVNRRRASFETFQQLIDQSMGTTVIVYIAFASLIAIGVVYNSARISLSERARELASMRVLGFYRREVAILLLGELAALTLIAIPIGCVMGYYLASLMVQEFGNDVFRLPLIVETSTYAYAAIVVVLATILSGALVARRVAKLDLIAVLKTRD